MCPLDFQIFNLSGHFRTAPSLKLVAYPGKNIQTYSFVTVYCVNFMIFLCVSIKLFFLTFMPLLAPNSGDTSEVSEKTLPFLLLARYVPNVA